MQINFSLTDIDVVQMRQILANSGVGIGKCFRLETVQFLSHERNTIAQYRLCFADATGGIVEVYFDSIGLAIKAEAILGVLV